MIEKYNEINASFANLSLNLIKQNNDKNYRVIKIKDIAIVNSGKGTKKLGVGKYKIIGANGCLGYTNEYNLSDKAIITGRVGTIGTFKQVDDLVWCSDNTIVIKTIYFNFLYYYLQLYFDYKSLNRGSTQPLIVQTDLLDYNIRMPYDVDKIEKELDDIYVQIKRNKKIIKMLSTLKQHYLKKFFG